MSIIGERCLTLLLFIQQGLDHCIHGAHSVIVQLFELLRRGQILCGQRAVHHGQRYPQLGIDSRYSFKTGRFNAMIQDAVERGLGNAQLFCSRFAEPYCSVIRCSSSKVSSFISINPLKSYRIYIAEYIRLHGIKSIFYFNYLL